MQPERSVWSRAALPVAAGVAVAGAIFLALARDLFVPPACDGPEVVNAVKELFKSTEEEKVTVSEVESLTGSDTQRCAAHVVSSDEDVRAVYSISWRWWSPSVKLETVEPLAGPRVSGATTPGIVPAATD